jgi:hypothetical protein
MKDFLSTTAACTTALRGKNEVVTAEKESAYDQVQKSWFGSVRVVLSN